MKMFGICFVAILLFGSVGGLSAASIDSLLGQYFIIHKSLSSDTMVGVSDAAAQIEKMSNQAAGVESEAKDQLSALARAAAKLKTGDLKSARNEFGELSDRMMAVLKTTEAKRIASYQFYCPMVKKNWLQSDKSTRNPYYGSSMLTCGQLVQTAQQTEKPAENHHH